VGLDRKWDDRRWAVSKILLQGLCLYGGGHGVVLFSTLYLVQGVSNVLPVAGQRNNR
jgi:hypothetical protein